MFVNIMYVGVCCKEKLLNYFYIFTSELGIYIQSIYVKLHIHNCKHAYSL